jgi:hypothetical protein
MPTRHGSRSSSKVGPRPTTGSAACSSDWPWRIWDEDGRGARREAGVQLMPISRDGYLGPYVRCELVRIYTLVDEPELALPAEPLLERRSTSPGWLGLTHLRPLRSNLQFRSWWRGSCELRCLGIDLRCKVPEIGQTIPSACIFHTSGHSILSIPRPQEAGWCFAPAIARAN